MVLDLLYVNIIPLQGTFSNKITSFLRLKILLERRGAYPYRSDKKDIIINFVIL